MCSVLTVEADLLMLPDALLVAAVAHGDIAVIAAQHHLGTLGDDIAVGINAGIDGGLGGAVTDGLEYRDAS